MTIHVNVILLLLIR